MNPLTLLLIAIRGTALALELQGQSRSSSALYAVADAAEAGKNVDDHLAAIAEKLKDRSASDEDWQDVTDRIEADSARLQGS